MVEKKHKFHCKLEIFRQRHKEIDCRFCDSHLRPDHGLEDAVQLVRAEAVRVEAVEEILDPQDAQTPQVLQGTDAACTQLQSADTRQTI